jgi:FdhD protein
VERETWDVSEQASGRRALGYSEPTVRHSFQTLGGDPAEGRLAAEVPVALVYNGRPHVVMMCTPADLEDFAVGFTFTEGIAQPADIRRTDVVKYARGIEVQLEITPAAADALASRGRQLTGRTGCGLCGVETIDEALREVAPVRSSLRVTSGVITRAGELLGARQPLNADTHAIHAAAWCDASGDPQVVREDVGRHNALDKVIGALVREGRAAHDGFVVVTSRASYELVQKAAVANIPLLAAVSRPTALAVRLAADAGITLVGLLRGESANVYTHPGRLLSD